MKRFTALMITTAVVYPAFAQNVPTPDAAHPVFVQPQDIMWKEYPGGSKVAILHIDPKTQTTELMIWNPKNTHVPRHWHSANEKISIISGTFVMKHDDGGDPVELNAGAFAYIPAKMIHEAWTKPDMDSLYFITVDGAWDYNVVDSPKQVAK
jgi:mannose-6-phosphate isomerase-like protein (cupin superfamily)